MIAISATQARTLKFWLPGRVVPKARPRFNGGNISLPRNYRGWKNTAYLEIIKQLGELSDIDLPIKKASVEVHLLGQLKGDADNILGSYLDLLVMANILCDDRLTCVPEVSLKSITGKSIGANIVITPLD